jgi:hypothetical protein
MFFSCFLSGRFISVTCGTNFFSEKRKSRPEHAAKTLFQSGFLGKSGGGRPKKTQCLRKLLCITDFTSFQHGGGIIQHIVHQHFVSTKPPRLGGRDASATLPAPPLPLPSPFISPLQMGERWENDGRTMGERWENDGRTMGERWENDGRTMGQRAGTGNRNFTALLLQHVFIVTRFTPII